MTSIVNTLGIAHVVYWDAAAMLADGTLVAIELEDAKTIDLDMWAAFPTRRQVPTRVRALID